MLSSRAKSNILLESSPRSGEAALTRWAPGALGSSSKPREQNLRPSSQISKGSQTSWHNQGHRWEQCRLEQSPSWMRAWSVDLQLGRRRSISVEL